MPDSEVPGKRIAVSCPCGASFTVDSKLAGKQGLCPNCKKPIIIPTATGKRVCLKCHFMNAVGEEYCSACGSSLALAGSPEAESSRPWLAEAKGEARPSKAPDTRRMSGSPAPRKGSQPPAAASSAPRVGEKRQTEIRRNPPPPAALAPEAAVAPPAAEPGETAAPKRTNVLRNKLAEMDAPRRPLLLRVVVFLVLAGGSGAGAFYGSRAKIEPKIAQFRDAEAAAKVGVWPGHVLDSLHDKMVELSRASRKENPLAPASPEELAMRKTVEAEFERMKQESQAAAKQMQDAHTQMQNWQVGWYGVIGVIGFVVGLIGWKLSS
ncbi:MAG: hypothetical protein K8T20_13900 [Planctomycetes bacterium]|nr:hypothetical protein [Planctomycetota bacterium]